MNESMRAEFQEWGNWCRWDALKPGLQVAAEIKQGHRTVLEYLLSPVSKTVHEAGRER